MTRAAAIKHGYTTGARTLASRSVLGLARTRVTPNALTASGVLLCGIASGLVLLEDRNELLFYWLAALVFVVGSLLDILAGIVVALLAAVVAYRRPLWRRLRPATA